MCLNACMNEWMLIHEVCVGCIAFSNSSIISCKLHNIPLIDVIIIMSDATSKTRLFNYASHSTFALPPKCEENC